MEPAPMNPMPGMICAAMRVWSPRILDRQRVRKQRIHRGAETDEEIRAQAGRTMLELALQSDGASQQRSQHQAQQGYPSRRTSRCCRTSWMCCMSGMGTLSGWILSPENLRFLTASARGKLTQMITGTEHESGRSSPWARPEA